MCYNTVLDMKTILLPTALSGTELPFKKWSSEMITQAELKDILSYNPKTGIFTWNKTKSNRIKIGDECGSITSLGYKITKIKGKYYSLHRLSWLYMYGEFPDGIIDHINQNRGDNRISNLRCITRAENNKNRTLQSNNKSGVNGVHWISTAKRWAAVINIEGKRIGLGWYRNKEDAIQARKEANLKYGFSPNHGKRIT